MNLPETKLDALLARHRTVEAELSGAPERDTYVKLSREFSELSPLVERIKSYRAVGAEIADIDAMLSDATTDRDMRALAESEQPTMEEERDGLAPQIRLALI